MPNSSNARCARYRDDRPRRLVGEELARLALQFQPIAQTAPFAAVGVVDEHRQDARPRPAQPRRCDLEQPAAHGDGHLVGAPGARRHDEHAPTGRGDGEMRLRTELAPQRRHQAGVGVAPGQHQRVEPQHGRLVVIAAAAGLQQAADAAVHLGQGTAQQALRQCHLQQVSPGIGGEPGAQVGVHPIGQMRPGAAMHQPPLLGRHDFAGDLRLGSAPRDQQVIGRIVFQPGEGNR